MTNAANQTLKIGGNATITGLTATAVPNTVEYNGTAAQAAKTGGTYNNLIISSGGTVTFGGSFNVSGDLTDNGYFSHTAGTVTFNGTVAQNLKKTGAATNTTFINLALNNTAAVATRQLILDHNLTVTTLLTLTAGRITTGAANNVYVANGTAIASSGGNDFVEGNLRKPYAIAALSRVFEIGNYNATAAASKYTPVTLAFAAVSVAGDITVSTTNADHPQFAGSGLDVANHVNRYWVVTNSGVTFATYTLTLNYIAGAPAAGDIDATATAAAFIATRYDGANWNATTLNAIPSTTQTVLTGVTAVGDFAIGEALGYNPETAASSGRFNAYDNVTGASVQGYIRTKTAGTAFTLRVVHLTAAAIANIGAAGTITVSVIDASSPTGTFDTTTNCYPSWVSATAITSVTIAATALQNTWTTPAITVPNSYKNARIRLTFPTVITQTGCSSDAFAIIPASFGITDSDDTSSTPGNTNTRLSVTTFNGTPVHKAGLPFSVRVNSTVPAGADNYYKVTAHAGNPSVQTAACVNPTGGSPACTTCNAGNLALGTFSVVSSELNSTATYDEVGVFDLTFQDTAYAAVDLADMALASRTIAQTAAFRTGRFIPNDFLLTVYPGNTPQFQTFGVPDASCNAAAPAPKRSFTYVGQSFGYATAPKVLVTARNGLVSPTATTNYQECLWRLVAGDVTRTPSTSNAGKTLNSSRTDAAPQTARV